MKKLILLLSIILLAAVGCAKPGAISRPQSNASGVGSAMAVK